MRQGVSVNNAGGLQGCGDVALHPGRRSPLHLSQHLPVSRYGFLTTDANADVGAYHSKAMPVILTQEAEWDLWMSDAPWGEVAHLQRSLLDGALQIVARGVRQDEALPA
jgi:putative SOS response-associated peptidase YedK